MLNRFYVWISDTRGVTGFEYSFIVAVIGLFVMAATMMMGDQIVAMFGEEGMGGFLDVIVESDTATDL